MKTNPQKPKVTDSISINATCETLMLMESLKIYFECEEDALFELMTRKLFDETFYKGLSPLVKSFLAKADKPNIPSEEKHIIFINPPELHEPMFKRIDPLEKNLRGMAFGFVDGDQLEADDIYGAMIDEIFFKCKPDDSDACILATATRTARAKTEKIQK